MGAAAVAGQPRTPTSLAVTATPDPRTTDVNEIAELHHIATTTVTTHVSSILTKVDVRDVPKQSCSPVNPASSDPANRTETRHR
jgi:hypothetical protein